MFEDGVSIGKEVRPPLQLSRSVPDSFSCFCATVVFRIQNRLLEVAYVPYRRNGIGSSVRKLAGGMGKKGESPLQIIAREIHEELGLEIEEKDFQFCFSTSPLSDPKHIKLFFVITREIKEKLRDTPYDAETGAPQWVTTEWLAKNLFGVHKEVFPKAVDILLQHFMEHENAECLIAAVKSGLLEPDDKVKELLLQKALDDRKFAFANAEELEDLGIGGGGYCF